MNFIPINKGHLIRFPIKDLKGNLCLSPYVSIEIDIKGSVRLCQCSQWLPTISGNIFDQDIHEILNNEISSTIRQSILSGTYEYCDESRCGVLSQNLFNTRENIDQDLLSIIDDPQQYIMPREIRIAGDETCNLSCPSCRQKVIKNSDFQAKQNIELGKKMQKHLFSRPTNNVVNLHVSSSGELFASPLLMSFVNKIPIDQFPNLNIMIQTNGLLAPKMWKKLGQAQNRVKMITVTIDASTANTYEKLRRGGKWKDIQKAMTWISNKKKENGMRLHVRLVAQYENYREIPEFYQQGLDWGADEIEISRILNWYIMPNFPMSDVFDPTHPNYPEAQDTLNQLKNKPKIFLCGGIHFT